MRRFAMAAGAALVLLGGAGAAVLVTQATSVTELITVPYSIAGQTGQVVLTDTDTVQTVTETQTVTVTAPPTTTTTPPPTTTDTTPTTTMPPPPTTLTASQCASRAAVAGAVIDNVTVTGGCTIGAANVTIRNSTLSGSVSIGPSAGGAKLLDSKALGFDLKGADNVTVQGNTFDGQGRRDNNEVWDSPAGNVPDNWVIRGNTFKNFYIDDGSTHSEALFIGYSQGGLIEGNAFTNNGNTGHLFFSWWGGVADPKVSYPRNICIRSNVFNATHDAFYDANFRDEIPTSAGIKLERDASTGWPRFYADC